MRLAPRLGLPLRSLRLRDHRAWHDPLEARRLARRQIPWQQRKRGDYRAEGLGAPAVELQRAPVVQMQPRHGGELLPAPHGHGRVVREELGQVKILRRKGRPQDRRPPLRSDGQVDVRKVELAPLLGRAQEEDKGEEPPSRRPVVPAASVVVVHVYRWPSS